MRPISLGAMLLPICLPLILMISPARAQISLIGNNHTEFSANTSDELMQQGISRDRFFENWTEADLHYDQLHAGARLSMYNAPQPFATDQSIRRFYLEHRFLEYSANNLNVRLGTAYSLFGRGLVLRLFENRQLRYNTRLDGVKTAFNYRFLDVTVLAGQPVSRTNERQKAFQATELRLRPMSEVQVGGSMVSTKPLSQSEQRVYWGSMFAELNLPFGALYGEYAMEDYPEASDNGQALYLNLAAFVGALSLSAEYKDYDRFEQNEGVYFNNPPLVAREHLFTLLNRHQLVQDADNERGIMLEGSYPVIEDGIFLLNFSLTEDQLKAPVYREYYGQFEWYSPFDWEFTVGAGRQEERHSTRHLNFVNSTGIPLNDLTSIKLTYEHQHTLRHFNGQQFYSHALTMGLSRAPNWTLSFLGERTTEQTSEQKTWAALQLDLSLFNRLDLALFGGTRRLGKICVGGVCINKPALSGLELTLITRL